MTDIYEALEKLGLTRNEVTIYKYLLRKGVSTGAQIWAENSLDKSSAYRAIGQLQEKRLIYAIGETRNQKFSAYPVEALVELHSKVEKNLSSVRSDIDKFIQDINEYAKENYKSSRIQLYEGAEGFRLFTNQRLNGHVELIRQIAPASLSFEGFDQINDDFIKMRVKRGVPIRLLCGIGDKSGRKHINDVSNLKEVRHVSLNFGESVGMATHAQSISIFTKEDGKFLGLVITDPFIVRMFNVMFDAIWDQAK